MGNTTLAGFGTWNRNWTARPPVLPQRPGKTRTTGERNGRMNKKTIRSTLPLLVGVLAILSVSSFLLFIRREPKIELNPYQALGTVAAEETIKLMGDKAQIVVAAQDSREFA